MIEIHPPYFKVNPVTGLSDHQSFQPFAKMARLNREVVVTEKLDGTNAQIYIFPTTEMGFDHYKYVTIWNGEFAMAVGSRNRWILPGNDNYGFARWCMDNFGELLKLGPGRHFGEFWGGSIQRGYGLKEKRFSLFNVIRWQYTNGTGSPLCQSDGLGGWIAGPACCHVVPTIWRGDFNSFDARDFVEMLRSNGSFAAPGFMQPEGIVLYHTAAGKCFKVTLENDEKPKGLAGPLTSEQLIAGKPAADEVFRQKCEQ